MRGEYLSPCQVDAFLPALKQETAPKNPKSWQHLILRQARTNHRLQHRFRARVPFQPLIPRNQFQRLGSGLGNQRAVERILMVPRKTARRAPRGMSESV